VNGAVTWTYVVTNTGDLPLHNVVVTDDVLGEICTIGDLAVGGNASCTATGTAAAGQYANLGTACGLDPIDTQICDTDPSHYIGRTPAIHIEKATNGEDADDPTGPVITVGDTVTWTYVVTNTGDLALHNVVVTDDVLGEICTIGDLAIGGNATCTATGTSQEGQYANIGTTCGLDPIGTEVCDTDPSHYVGIPPDEPPDGLTCRVTGGLNNVVDASGNRYTAGGQAGASTALPPQPKGEWTHTNHDGPFGDFTFHAGTASAPAGTEILEIRCSDPNGCKPSGDPPSPVKQIDFDGIGTFKNVGKGKGAAVPSFVTAGANVKAEGGNKKTFKGTFHFVQVNIDDLGEVGNSNPKKNPGDVNPAMCPVNGFGEKGDQALANCDCSDFYRITISDGINAAQLTYLPDGSLDAASIALLKAQPVIYTVSGYVDGGNLQIHRPTGQDTN
jgi:hypothetical protein